MRKVFFVFIVFAASFSVAQAQYKNWAVGFQLGEPSGVNARKYFADNKAFDVSIGTYGLFYGRDRSYRSGNYQNAGVSLRATYLWHTNLFKSESLQGYYGFGGQINSRRYYFVPQGQSTLVHDKQTSLGAVGLAGAEYFLSNSPLSVFLEGGLYAEVLPVPFFLVPQISAGVRLNF